MPASELQLSKLITKLLSNTEAGTLKWEPALMPGAFHTRISDFVVEIKRPLFSSTIGSAPSIEVTKLTGATVARAGEQPIYGDSTNLSPEARDNLVRLYDMVSNRDSDLERLIEML